MSTADPAAASPEERARAAHNELVTMLYERSGMPVREIATLCGISERNIYARVRRLGCTPRIRLAPGGGRRIVPFGEAPPQPPDAAAVERALAACRQAVADVQAATAARLRERAQRDAERQARRAAAAARPWCHRL
jgi:predicted DNA-binding transcriptional regulator YafY